jgi:type IX secretion system PorP/SprF family membrane protein
MKKLNLFIIALVLIINAGAQQLHTSSLYDMQGVFHNPSTAGTRGTMAGVSYRSQWDGISGSPRTVTAFGAIDLNKHNIGLGGYIYNDKTGPTSRTGLSVAFAKHIPTNNGGRFSLGLEARGQQFAIDRAALSATLGADPALGNQDNRFMFDAGFGVSYSNDKMQFGASVSQLVQSKLDFYTGSLPKTEDGRLYRHYYLHGSYKLTVDKFTTIKPNALVIYMPNAPTEYQFGATVEHMEKFWWGVGHRVKQSFMLSAGLHVSKKFTIGYCFDIYSTPLSVFDEGANAHELMIRFNAGK